MVQKETGKIFFDSIMVLFRANFKNRLMWFSSNNNNSSSSNNNNNSSSSIVFLRFRDGSVPVQRLLAASLSNFMRDLLLGNGGEEVDVVVVDSEGAEDFRVVLDACLTWAEEIYEENSDWNKKRRRGRRRNKRSWRKKIERYDFFAK